MEFEGDCTIINQIQQLKLCKKDFDTNLFSQKNKVLMTTSIFTNNAKAIMTFYIFYLYCIS